MLLLFGFVVFLVLSCVVYAVYVVYIVCKALFKALFFCKEDHIHSKGQEEDVGVYSRLRQDVGEQETHSIISWSDRSEAQGDDVSRQEQN